MREATGYIEEVGSALYDRYNEVVGTLLKPRCLPDQIPDLDYPIGWTILNADGTVLDQVPELSHFVGYLDLETTGLLGDSHVLCGVGIGEFLDEAPTDNGTRIVVYRGCGSRVIPIQDCFIANWNQPFDRQFYPINGLWDPNTHLDLYGLTLAVRGKPEEWSLRTREDWPEYVLPDLSLAAVSEAYLGERISKEVRNQLVSGAEVSFKDLVAYCYIDTLTTLRVGQRSIQEYLCSFPNPITLHGHILRHSFVIPLSDKWGGYIDRVNTWYKSELDSLVQIAIDRLPIAASHGDPHSTCIRDNWPDKYKKPTKRMLANPLYNEWLALLGEELILYKFLWEPIKLSSSLFSLLLGLTWDEDGENPEPILYDRADKTWWAGTRQLINKANPKSALATPICKAYEGEIKSGKISSAFSSEVQPILKRTQRWKAFKSRVESIRPRTDENGKLYWVPTYSPTGTLTHRATDKILLLIGSPKYEVGGSEFMSMIEARDGYRIVQADLDAGELVLAGLIAASYEGVDREIDNEFARANLTGDKANGTDIPSLLATRTGSQRGDVKNLVYGSIYGQGSAGRVEKLLSIGLSMDRALEISELFEKEFIKGLAGTFFLGNKMLTTLNAPTAMLGKKLPLAYLHAGRDGMTSRWNHNVQALGEDWLSAIAAIVDYIIPNSPDTQLILTRHDELVYHCKEEKVPALVEAMTIAHYVTRVFLCEVFGMKELPPDQWLRFSSIDVNHRYLKSQESNPSTVTTQF